MSKFRRSCGIVIPIFSIPSKYGIGTFGKEAYKFVDFLERAGQKYWQILPLGHTGFGNSPYQCFSTVAGNPYFIDLDLLVKMGLLSENDLITLNSKDISKVDYQFIEKTRLNVLKIAYRNSSYLKNDIEAFCY